MRGIPLLLSLVTVGNRGRKCCGGCLLPSSLFVTQCWPRQPQRRQCRVVLQSTTLFSSSSLFSPDNNNAPLEAAEQTLLKLCQTTNRQHATWLRFQPLIHLALEYNNNYNNRHDGNKDVHSSSIVDIGTDHGLLAFALAATGQFASVTGLDASRRALQDGAWANAAQLQGRGIAFPVALQPFVHGDGLRPLYQQQCATDVICLAGMGVNTMQDILTDTNNKEEFLIHSLKVQVVLVQPTNTRPRNLIALYTCLVAQLGFAVRQERLQRLNGRWYISVAFVRANQTRQLESSYYSNSNTAPHSQRLLCLDDFPLAHYQGDPSLRRGYVEHHVRWLQKELGQAGKLRGREDEWLAKFQSCLLPDEDE